jgi:hypothetical protein
MNLYKGVHQHPLKSPPLREVKKRRIKPTSSEETLLPGRFPWAKRVREIKRPGFTLEIF